MTVQQSFATLGRSTVPLIAAAIVLDLGVDPALVGVYLAIGAVAGFNPYVIVGKMVASSSGISDITQQGRIAGGIAEAVAESLRAHGQLPAR